MTEWHRCPRCYAAVVYDGSGALSRTTRDNDGAEIEVCPRCGERESLYGYEPAAQRPFTEWPLTPDQLAAEERRLIAGYQAAEWRVETIGPDEAGDMLDTPPAIFRAETAFPKTQEP